MVTWLAGASPGLVLVGWGIRKVFRMYDRVGQINTEVQALPDFKRENQEQYHTILAKLNDIQESLDKHVTDYYIHNSPDR